MSGRKYVAAVDPGIRGCGVVVFGGYPTENNARLMAAIYVKNPVKKGDDFDAVLAMAYAVASELTREWSAMPEAPKLLVLEWPRVYTASKSKGDNNDLLPLVAVDAAIAMQWSRSTAVERVFPHEWKGQMTKEVTQARVATRLDAEERAVLDAGLKAAGKTLGHNVWDAVGIGLYAVGRFTYRKVIAR